MKVEESPVSVKDDEKPVPACHSWGISAKEETAPEMLPYGAKLVTEKEDSK